MGQGSNQFRGKDKEVKDSIGDKFYSDDTLAMQENDSSQSPVIRVL